MTLTLDTSALYAIINEGDPDRDRILRGRDADLSLGLADASVLACTERHTGRVLTLDRRDLDVVARGEGAITVLPG